MKVIIKILHYLHRQSSTEAPNIRSANKLPNSAIIMDVTI